MISRVVESVLKTPDFGFDFDSDSENRIRRRLRLRFRGILILKNSQASFYSLKVWVIKKNRYDVMAFLLFIIEERNIHYVEKIIYRTMTEWKRYDFSFSRAEIKSAMFEMWDICDFKISLWNICREFGIVTFLPTPPPTPQSWCSVTCRKLCKQQTGKWRLPPLQTTAYIINIPHSGLIDRDGNRFRPQQIS